MQIANCCSNKSLTKTYCIFHMNRSLIYKHHQVWMIKYLRPYTLYRTDLFPENILPYIATALYILWINPSPNDYHN